MIAGLDTSTPVTTVAVLGPRELELHDDGEKPRHAQTLQPLLERVLEQAGASWDEIERLCVGVGPGGFTGLRLGVATARAIAQARQIPLAPVSSLDALAAPHHGRVAAVIDARRGEVFAALYEDGERTLEPVALAPETLAGRLSRGTLAVGDGAVRFRMELERAGADVPADGSDAHRVSALMVCRLGRAKEPVDRDALLPDYRREPDAKPQ
ncbi:tRNA (adenosine(37)-N6)-threonylcarbamoyltransferase complex dimerization subunit type 1 TsaB [Candidatus Solirubrobacter pratensis]|uniref:tRNA (adenosine(37)-N6)-threonylcarbamoyltransferase complex dimerization subunit type 1 TsaB n=1 Tax=Candidatus Solirubrobacter pratensis TaxID=1298857 RepID=UPI0003FBA89A|nr:tRNA (adenosine(37)-N6)-threonylcarbamoyltransferase complex dimerization subunit type 1 TsaB [Candidatus Solirubrobacter pratensis]